MTGTAGRILHLAHVDEWNQTLLTGWFDRSTRGRTLAQEGFIHTSTAGQLPMVAQRFYADDPEPLLLLVIDIAATEAAGSPVRWDPAEGELFPHVYGPVPADAVVAAIPVEFDGNRLVLPDLGGLDVVDRPPAA
ncbi:DUF952 domain-containing protein [Nakamurella deserti]|uniref:DUF952 domain-containing protein n=1 Tax=Nakamurella deserti TaxID=2164074 RepID=UPI000DBE3435|nr:DUF952 domain-containing protein [Nakamurella deserti]